MQCSYLLSLFFMSQKTKSILLIIDFVKKFLFFLMLKKLLEIFKNYLSKGQINSFCTRKVTEVENQNIITTYRVQIQKKNTHCKINLIHLY